jgi:SAM-dependent methyltransferase
VLGDIEEELKTIEKHALILDIGCGYGYFIQICIEKGYDCVGVDFSKYALSKIQNKSLGVTLCNAQSALPVKSKSVDVVVMLDVLEHLDNFPLALKEIKRTLKRDGLLYIATPNLGAIARLFKGKNWYGYLDKTHVSLFTCFSLKKYLKRYNFEILRCYTPFNFFILSKLILKILEYSYLGGQIRLVARNVT